jgi:hypothetical protein
MGDTDWNGENPWQSGRGIDYARPMKVHPSPVDHTDFRLFVLAQGLMECMLPFDFRNGYRICH